MSLSSGGEEFAQDKRTVLFFKFFFASVIVLYLVPSIEYSESWDAGRIMFTGMSQGDEALSMNGAGGKPVIRIIWCILFYMLGSFMSKSKLYFLNGKLFKEGCRSTREIDISKIEKIVLYKSRDGEGFCVQIYSRGQKRTGLFGYQSLFGYERMNELVRQIEKNTTDLIPIVEKTSRWDLRNPLMFIMIIILAYLLPDIV